jgi:myo-inositol 2-dehydrogenase / D-chiro-inositol 1-dehydrogenase
MGRVHARTLAEHPRVAGLTVVDVDRDTAERTAAQVGARAEELEGALADADAALVAAATPAHREAVDACVSVGLPTFCEAPLGSDTSDAAAIAGVAEEAGAPLQVGFQRRFDAGFRRARELVESGRLGQLHSLRLATHGFEGHDGPGGALHLHDLDCVRWLSGSAVAQVHAAGDSDAAAALLSLEDGGVAVVTGARRDPLGFDVRAELYGSEDSVVVGLGPRTPLRPLDPGTEDLLPGTRHHHFSQRFHDAYRAEIAHFLEVARGEAVPACTAADALEAHLVAEAAERSLAERRPMAPAEVRGSGHFSRGA